MVSAGHYLGYVRSKGNLVSRIRVNRRIEVGLLILDHVFGGASNSILVSCQKRVVGVICGDKALAFPTLQRPIGSDWHLEGHLNIKRQQMLTTGLWFCIVFFLFIKNILGQM